MLFSIFLLTLPLLAVAPDPKNGNDERQELNKPTLGTINTLGEAKEKYNIADYREGKALLATSKLDPSTSNHYAAGLHLSKQMASAAEQHGCIKDKRKQSCSTFIPSNGKMAYTATKPVGMMLFDVGKGIVEQKNKNGPGAGLYDTTQRHFKERIEKLGEKPSEGKLGQAYATQAWHSEDAAMLLAARNGEKLKGGLLSTTNGLGEEVGTCHTGRDCTTNAKKLGVNALSQNSKNRARYSKTPASMARPSLGSSISVQASVPDRTGSKQKVPNVQDRSKLPVPSLSNPPSQTGSATSNKGPAGPRDQARRASIATSARSSPKGTPPPKPQSFTHSRTTSDSTTALKTYAQVASTPSRGTTALTKTPPNRQRTSSDPTIGSKTYAQVASTPPRGTTALTKTPPNRKRADKREHSDTPPDAKRAKDQKRTKQGSPTPAQGPNLRPTLPLLPAASAKQVSPKGKVKPVESTTSTGDKVIKRSVAVIFVA